jgi:hypothetical protein
MEVPILILTEEVDKIVTGNSNFIEAFVVEVKTSLSPEANPLPEIVTSEFKGTEIVPGIETPVNLNESVGTGGSFLEHPDIKTIPAINRIEKYLIDLLIFIFNLPLKFHVLFSMLLPRTELP